MNPLNLSPLCKRSILAPRETKIIECHKFPVVAAVDTGVTILIEPTDRLTHRVLIVISVSARIAWISSLPRHVYRLHCNFDGVYKMICQLYLLDFPDNKLCLLWVVFDYWTHPSLFPSVRHKSDEPAIQEPLNCKGKSTPLQITCNLPGS